MLRLSRILGLNGLIVMQAVERCDWADRQGFVEAFKRANNRFRAAPGLISLKGEANLIPFGS